MRNRIGLRNRRDNEIPCLLDKEIKRRRIYIANIQGSGGTKLPDLANRTSICSDVMLFETNCKAGDEKSINLGCKAVSLVDNQAGFQDKGLAFGTALMSKSFNPNTDEISYKSVNNEITALTQKLGPSVTMTTIAGYRSPNTKFSVAQIAAWYRELRGVVEKRISLGDDVVIVGMDDNSSRKNMRPWKELEKLRTSLDGVHVINEPTRGDKQPDHVLAFYDPIRFTVTGMVVPGVGDHSAMVVDIESAEIVNIKPQWNKRRVVLDEGDPKCVEMDLRSELNGYFDEFGQHLLLSTFINNEGLTSWMANDIMEKVKYVRERHQTAVVRTMPEGVERIKTKSQREVQYRLNKVHEAYTKLRREPKKVNLKLNLIKCKKIYREVCQEEAIKTLKRDINKMGRYHRVDTRRFFAATERHLRFEGAPHTKSQDEVQKALVAAEQNYVLRGEAAAPRHIEGIIKERDFLIIHDEEFVKFRISKLKKVDKFYKLHANVLATPISVLLQAIEATQTFPESCKVTNLALLPKRTIFSLDFLAKILEDVIGESMDDLLPPEMEGQFAYQKGRSTEACVAIGLQKIEECPESCVNTDFDCKKAFDSTYWKTVVQEMERRIGAGSFFLDYLSGRTYIYDCRKGFIDRLMGRGTPPGTKLGPRLFSIFQETDYAMNLSNDTWLWPGKFSDDKSPIARWENVRNGRMQEALDGTWSWREENHIDYHLIGDKRPKYYVFRKHDDEMEDYNSIGLRMGEHPIERDYEKVQLGIRMRVFKDDEVPNKAGYELNWRGKEALSRLTYRLHDMKYSWLPEFTRTCVTSYVIGKLQYGSSLYWLRASKQSINKARYDYIHAMSAVVGLSLPEVLGKAACGSNARVAETNENYRKLCRYLNLPTLEDMAIKSARRLIAQWFMYEPEKFTVGSKEPEKETPDTTSEETSVEIIGNPNNKGVLIKVTKQETVRLPKVTETVVLDKVDAPSGTLLYELFELAKKKPNNWYPHYEKARKLGKEARNELPKDCFPEWKQDWDTCVSMTTERFKKYGMKPATNLDFMNTFWLTNRDRFNVLEIYARTAKRLDVDTEPAGGLAAKRKGADDDVRPSKRSKTQPTSKACVVTRHGKRKTQDSLCEERPMKRTKGTVFECGTKPPVRRGRKPQSLCWICGYTLKKDEKLEMNCCEKQMHKKCWLNQPVVRKNTPKICQKVSHYMKKCQTVKDDTATEAGRVIINPTEKMECDLCNQDISVTRDLTPRKITRRKNHYMLDCSGIPGTPVDDRGNRKQVISRLATMGLRKRVGKYDEIVNHVKPQRSREGASPLHSAAAVAMADMLEHSIASQHVQKRPDVPDHV